jgi:chromosome segregation ATPase
MELKDIYSEEVATLKFGLTVAKDAMEEYRTRYAVDIDNLRTKKEQLEEQVFNLSLARRDAESLKHRLKLDLEIAQKESETLRQEDKLNKNMRAVLEEKLHAAQAEISRLAKFLENAHNRQLAETKNFDSLFTRLLALEKKFERADS